jgi:fatty acid desaturase
VGYWMAYIQLFFHEAAHFGLAPKRALNDFLANLAIGAWIGQNVKVYRKVHFTHHRSLGTAEDTEQSYFERLTLRFIVESLTGVRIVRILLLRQSALREHDRNRSNSVHPKARISDRWPLFAGFFAHVVLLALWASHRHWVALAAWCIGVGSVYPFLTSLRQLLEHRPISVADSTVLQYEAAHRLFGDGLLSSTFGAAGFNRHLLHHMEPQISYTRLPELEGFVKGSPLASWLEGHRASYSGILSNLIRSDRRRTKP